MNATITKEAVLILPDLGVSYRYFVLSSQAFSATIAGI
jgi:hypothetical protein